MILASTSNPVRTIISIFPFSKMLEVAKSCSADAFPEFNSTRDVLDTGCPGLSLRDNTIFTLLLSKLLNRDDGN